MLTALIFLPLIGGLIVLLLPRRQRRAIQAVAFGAAVGALLLTVWSAARLHSGSGAIEEELPWIAAIGATYALALDGISLPLISLTAVLTLAALVYSPKAPDDPTTSKEFLSSCC